LHYAANFGAAVMPSPFFRLALLPGSSVLALMTGGAALAQTAQTEVVPASGAAGIVYPVPAGYDMMGCYNTIGVRSRF
jgi:hypothetical protein